MWLMCLGHVMSIGDVGGVLFVLCAFSFVNVSGGC